MQFTPKTEKELAERGLLPVGVYPFEVLNATDKTSANGNEMIVLDLLIHCTDGSNRKITDYLMEKVAFKLHGFCKAVGLIIKYNAGNFTAEDCLGKSGYLKLKIEDARPKDGGGEWPAKNSVNGYEKPDGNTASAAPKITPTADPLNGEDVPF